MMETLPLTLYRAEQVRELDQLAILEQGMSDYELMRRAGYAAFDLLQRQWPEAQVILVVCGGGNNGGDGYVLAHSAIVAGYSVKVIATRSLSNLSGAAYEAAKAYSTAGGEVVTPENACFDRVDIIVDALLGTGIRDAVLGREAQLIEAINQHGLAGVPVLALDIPSGLDADTGVPHGLSVCADITLTYVALKQGLMTGLATGYVGTLKFDDLAISARLYARVKSSVRRLDEGLLQQLLPVRPRQAHKGFFGHVLVVGGTNGLSGAARLAGEAALRVGAGLVSVATSEVHAAVLNTGRPELMVRGVEPSSPQWQGLLEKASILALGPGLGEDDWAHKLCAEAVAKQKPTVFDADGLNWLAKASLVRQKATVPWILTPHPGEAARLLGVTVEDIEHDRFTAVREIAIRYQAIVILKGAGTLVAAPDGECYLCDKGNPGMASGGMGDVLTGVIAGLWGQGLTPLQAAQAGVFVHALAADRSVVNGERGLLAKDLMPHLRRLVNPVLSESV